MAAPSGRAGIGTLNEKPLHAALKEYYARPGDRCEVPFEGFVVDIVRGDLLIEIQTGGFSALRRKLERLTATHRVRVIYPVAVEKWILRLDGEGTGVLGRRKSPKRDSPQQLFSELVSFPGLLRGGRLAIHLLLIREEEVRRMQAPRRYGRRRGRRRGGWIRVERRLLEVLDKLALEGPEDLRALLPESLGDPFLTADLSAALGSTRRLAQQMAYCLREAGVLYCTGKQGNALVYSRQAG